MATPQITVAGTLDDLFGAAQAGSLVVQLCGYGSQVPRVVGTALIAQTAPLPISAPGGTYNFKLWGNDVITPSGTFYTITVIDANGNRVQINAYQFSGTETVDLANATPYNPPPPTPTTLIPVYTNPPGQSSQAVDGPLAVEQTLSTSILDVSSTAGSLDIDGELSNVFRIVLTENVTDVTFANMIPGATYTFIIVQNSTGGWTFAWPASALNPVSPVNPVANGKTVWTGVCDIDGTVMSNGYYP